MPSRQTQRPRIESPSHTPSPDHHNTDQDLLDELNDPLSRSSPTPQNNDDLDDTGSGPTEEEELEDGDPHPNSKVHQAGSEIGTDDEDRGEHPDIADQFSTNQVSFATSFAIHNISEHSQINSHPSISRNTLRRHHSESHQQPSQIKKLKPTRNTFSHEEHQLLKAARFHLRAGLAEELPSTKNEWDGMVWDFVRTAAANASEDDEEDFKIAFQKLAATPASKKTAITWVFSS